MLSLFHHEDSYCFRTAMYSMYICMSTCVTNLTPTKKSFMCRQPFAILGVASRGKNKSLRLRRGVPTRYSCRHFGISPQTSERTGRLAPVGYDNSTYFVYQSWSAASRHRPSSFFFSHFAHRQEDPRFFCEAKWFGFVVLAL